MFLSRNCCSKKCIDKYDKYIKEVEKDGYTGNCIENPESIIEDCMGNCINIFIENPKSIDIKDCTKNCIKNKSINIRDCIGKRNKLIEEIRKDEYKDEYIKDCIGKCNEDVENYKPSCENKCDENHRMTLSLCGRLNYKNHACSEKSLANQLEDCRRDCVGDNCFSTIYDTIFP